MASLPHTPSGFNDGVREIGTFADKLFDDQTREKQLGTYRRDFQQQNHANEFLARQPYVPRAPLQITQGKDARNASDSQVPKGKAAVYPKDGKHQ